MSAREGMRTRQQNQPYNPTGTYFRPQTGFNPLQGRPSNNYYSQFDNRNKSRYNPSGFWDGGFFWLVNKESDKLIIFIFLLILI